MKSKLVLSLMVLTLSLSACEGSLSSGTALKLDDNEINEIEIGYLNSRSDVAGITIDINLSESPLSDTITLATQSVENTTSIEYNRYSNRAIAYSESYNRSETTTATGFTTYTNTEERGYSWLGRVKDEEDNDIYYHYQYSNISYNNGYVSSNSTATGPIEPSYSDTYWMSYYIDLFYNDIFSQYIVETDSYGYSLYRTFSSVSLFDGGLTYVWDTKNSKASAYYSLSKLSTISNPLYPRDSSKNIPVVDLYDISYTFVNDKTYGYVLSNVSYSYQYQLLENFENHYLSNPRVIKTYNFDAYYSYSNQLGMTQIPNIDTTSAIFVPLLTTKETYLSSGSESYSVSSISNTINMSAVISDLYPSFNGYCYEIPLSITSSSSYYSYSYSFTSTLNTALEEI
ncbi:MAG: hypothetical protein LUD22_04055, partial [Coprobacillus sp.]|nr:hypothetical protein [Coprobacillus sp.]